jgi:hypothetical protein
LHYVHAGRDSTPIRIDRDDGGWGYADAFIDPPYSLFAAGRRLDATEIRELFLAVVRDVLRCPTDGTPIWGFEGDWCDWFAAGREWWGAAAWTVRVDPAGIVAVLASATD